MTSATTSVSVDYCYDDGWHVFTSPDLPGLLVAHQELKVAFDDVAPSIEMLVRADMGVECHASPEVPFDQFFEAEARKIPVGGMIKRFRIDREVAAA